MRELITSAQNPKIKELLALQEKSRLRRKEGLFVLEGRRELERCVAAGMKVRTVFVCPNIIGDEGCARDLAPAGVPKFAPPGGKKPEIPAGGSENVPPDRMALGDGSSATPILPTSWVPSLFGSQCRLTRTAIPSLIFARTENRRFSCPKPFIQLFRAGIPSFSCPFFYHAAS